MNRRKHRLWQAKFYQDLVVVVMVMVMVTDSDVRCFSYVTHYTALLLGNDRSYSFWCPVWNKLFFMWFCVVKLKVKQLLLVFSCLTSFLFCMFSQVPRVFLFLLKHDILPASCLSCHSDKSIKEQKLYKNDN